MIGLIVGAGPLAGTIGGFFEGPCLTDGNSPLPFIITGIVLIFLHLPYGPDCTGTYAGAYFGAQSFNSLGLRKNSSPLIRQEEAKL
ncbi:hypothetical protein P7H17_15320 [Paenibacillus larvae]|nr:hypothetical protein [Paenibacillus larvae]MDT2287126.1 hypothetical protein [Paenibacillus larvae]